MGLDLNYCFSFWIIILDTFCLPLNSSFSGFFFSLLALFIENVFKASRRKLKMNDAVRLSDSWKSLSNSKEKVMKKFSVLEMS